MNALALLMIIVFTIYVIILAKTTEKTGNSYIRISIAIRNLKLHVKSKYNDLNIMNRDIDVDYSPAVLSYLYNFKVEPKKDILATVLNLYNKGVITIEQNEREYKFEPVIEADLSRLTLDERYIYTHLIANKDNKNSFSSEDWGKTVIEEYQKYNFSEIKKDKPNKKIIYIISTIISLIITIIAMSLLFSKHGDDELIRNPVIFIGLSILVFIFSIPVSMITVDIFYMNIRGIKLLLSKLNNKGENEIIKWIKFKRFIKEYTLLEDKKIEEVVIYEKYIPYAMVLNVNKEYNNSKVQGFIKKYMKVMNKSVDKYLYTVFFQKKSI